MESMEIFIILDEIIEDLKSGCIGKKIYVTNKLLDLRNYHYIWENKVSIISYPMFLEYDRIIQRLYYNDVREAIIMIRELQDEVATYYQQGCRRNYRVKHNSVWYRFVEWKIESLHEQRN